MKRMKCTDEEEGRRALYIVVVKRKAKSQQAFCHLLNRSLPGVGASGQSRQQSSPTKT